MATDGPGSNNAQDNMETLKFTACLQKVGNLDAMALLPKDVLSMATVGGARAMGQLVYNANGRDVDTVIVDGEILMRDKHVLCLDEEALLAEARAACGSLFERAGITLS